MLAAHEREAARIHDEQTRGEAGCIVCILLLFGVSHNLLPYTVVAFVSHKSPFAVILEKSQLAQLLKHLYKR